MYRIFCESYKNFIKSFEEENYRLKMAEPLELLVDIDEYIKKENKQSEKFKKLCDLIYFMKENVERFPRLKAFIWTLSSRNIAKVEDLEEQTKLINSFLKLAYWY